MPPCSPCYHMWWIGRGLALDWNESFRLEGVVLSVFSMGVSRFYEGSTCFFPKF